MAQGIRYTLIADIPVAQVHIAKKVLAFQRQLLLQNISFLSFITKLTSAIVK